MYCTAPTIQAPAKPEYRAFLETLRDELVGLIDAKMSSSIHNTGRTPKAASAAENDLMTQMEVCRFLKLSKPTVIDYEKRGFLRVLRIGRRVYYRRSDIMRTLESGTTFRKAQ